MSNDQRALVLSSNNNNRDNNHEDQDQNQNLRDDDIRDIHAMTPPQPPVPPIMTNINRGRRREAWETSSHRSSSLSSELGGVPSENFTTMSREFNALVLAGSSTNNNNNDNNNNNNDTSHEVEGTINNNLGRIFEEETIVEENNSLAIVADNTNNNNYNNNNNVYLNPSTPSPNNNLSGISQQGEVIVHRVKKEEVESKISAWQTAKIAKINNRFKCEDAVINGWENEEVQKATSWMKKVEVCIPIRLYYLSFKIFVHVNGIYDLKFHL